LVDRDDHPDNSVQVTLMGPPAPTYNVKSGLVAVLVFSDNAPRPLVKSPPGMIPLPSSADSQLQVVTSHAQTA
jgi:hypothetical protein